jgi:hypothetical protein
VTKYQYPQAGEHAPPEVQAAIENFHMLPDSEKAKLPLLWFLLGDSTQAYKMLQADAEYTDSPVGVSSHQNCGNCDFGYKSLRWNVQVCSQIEGVIEPWGWCKLWERSPDSAYPY